MAFGHLAIQFFPKATFFSPVSPVTFTSALRCTRRRRKATQVTMPVPKGVTAAKPVARCVDRGGGRGEIQDGPVRRAAVRTAFGEAGSRLPQSMADIAANRKVFFGRFLDG